jgi:hypothetical protein
MGAERHHRDTHTKLAHDDDDRRHRDEVHDVLEGDIHRSDKHVGSILAFHSNEGSIGAGVMTADDDGGMHGHGDVDHDTVRGDGVRAGDGMMKSDHNNDSVEDDGRGAYDDEKFDQNDSVESDQNHGVSENMHHIRGDGHLDADQQHGRGDSLEAASHEKSMHASQNLSHERTHSESEHDQYNAAYRQSRSAPHIKLRAHGDAPVINVYTNSPKGSLQDLSVLSPTMEGKTPRSAGSPILKPLFLASKGMYAHMYACMYMYAYICPSVCVS